MSERPSASLAVAVAVLALVVPVAGCGGGDGSAALRVSAAASLKSVFTAYGRERTPSTSFSFAGSDELAAQIRAGARPDVFAAANPDLPAALFAEHLVARPVAFATNRLVLAVPAGSHIRALDDLARPEVKLAVGSPSVPVGSYTRTVLARLGGSRARRILANVRSQEPDVAGILGKLTQGAVDAGFVYATDVRATKGELRAIELPERLRPRVVYAAAVVRGSRRRDEARSFVIGLLDPVGRRELRRAGFLPPP